MRKYWREVLESGDDFIKALATAFIIIFLIAILLQTGKILEAIAQNSGFDEKPSEENFTWGKETLKVMNEKCDGLLMSYQGEIYCYVKKCVFFDTYCKTEKVTLYGGGDAVSS